MSRDQRRLILVIALLVVAVGVTLLISQRNRLGAGSAGGYEFVADVDNWQRTDRERAVTSPYNFNLGSDLNQLPMQIGDWTGTDEPQTNLEVFILLEPEQYIQRIYRLPDGRFVWLSLIGSRKSKSFHSPQICYDTDGWKTEASSVPVALAQGEIYALQLMAEKSFGANDTAEHLVTYFYLWPSYARNAQDGMVLLKVTSPLHGTQQDTVTLQNDFLRLLFTSARS